MSEEARSIRRRSASDSRMGRNRPSAKVQESQHTFRNRNRPSVTPDNRSLELVRPRTRRFASFEALAASVADGRVRHDRRVLVADTLYRVEGRYADSAGRTQVIVLAVHGDAGEVSSTLESAMAAHGLTRREAETAILLARRYRNAEIAQRLGVSLHTARHHTRRVMAKLNARTRLQVARLIRAG